jgi:hypothetical protein
MARAVTRSLRAVKSFLVATLSGVGMKLLPVWRIARYTIASGATQLSLVQTT